MNLLPTEDQIQIIDAVSAFLRQELPISRFREEHVNGGLTAEQRTQVGELGWLALGLDEKHGGFGSSIVEEVLIFREFGRQIAPLSLYAGTLSARVAAHAELTELATEIIDGTRQVAIAVSANLPVAASSRVTGDLYLIDYIGASHALLIDEQGAALLPIQKLSPTAMPCLESGQTLGLASPQDLAADAYIVNPGLAARARVLLAALQVGAAEATRDMAVAYANERQQFGKPIGSFQAIKHMCSDTAVRAEEAGSQLFYAALRVRNNEPDSNRESASALYLATRAALENSASNIQIHGGMGMTAEVDAHHYLKRAHLIDQIGGGRNGLLELVLQ